MSRSASNKGSGCVAVGLGQRGQGCAFLWSAGLSRSGLTTLRGALVMPLMSFGYRMGLIKFGLITATKPR